MVRPEGKGIELGECVTHRVQGASYDGFHVLSGFAEAPGHGRHDVYAATLESRNRFCCGV